jgi:arylsulfatase A-like enzyme
MVSKILKIYFPCLFLTLLSLFVIGQSKRPNIVFILADDLGYGDIGVNGQQLIRTPNINWLAKSGITFEQFYSGSTVCAPSRSALLTGQHTGHTYIRGNKAAQPEGEEPLADSIVTIAEVLKHSGYKTAAFGKWGLGPVGSAGDPNKQGFDFFYGYNSQGLAHRYYPDHLWDNDKRIDLKENENFLQTKIYGPDLIQQKAIEFIHDQKDGQPFFLYLPYILPHAELLVPDDSIFQSYKGKFPETPYSGNNYGTSAIPDGYTSQQYPHATFAAMVTRLDIYVGQILASLKEKGLDKNTLVIFSSDNGPHIEGGADPAFFKSNGIYKGVKRDLYEGGIHVPFIVYWPGVVKAGVSSNYTGAFWDVFPTFAAIAGASTFKSIDGISFLPTLNGKGIQRKHDYLYWEFHEKGGRQAIRKDNWKAIRLDVDLLPHGEVELYNLATDPGETKNVAKQFPAIAEELRLLIDQAHLPSQLFPFKNEK